MTDLKIPNHLAIVMDGNGRWAKSKNLPKKAGHMKGAESVRDVVKLCQKYGVNYLTLYTFSTENWNRPQEEVKDLMAILKKYLKNDIKDLIKNNVRVKFIGDRNRLDSDIVDLMEAAEARSENNKFCLIIAISYGGRDEIISAANEYAKSLEKKEGLLFEDFLYTKDIPDPDLFIRTSGECRISNFLLWQLAYTELHFTNTLWPDFSEGDLLKAFQDYSGRDRRYGIRNE